MKNNSFIVRLILGMSKDYPSFRRNLMLVFIPFAAVIGYYTMTGFLSTLGVDVASLQIWQTIVLYGGIGFLASTIALRVSSYTAYAIASLGLEALIFCLMQRDEEFAAKVKTALDTPPDDLKDYFSSI